MTRSKLDCPKPRHQWHVAVCLSALLIAGCRALPTLDGSDDSAQSPDRALSLGPFSGEALFDQLPIAQYQAASNELYTLYPASRLDIGLPDNLDDLADQFGSAEPAQSPWAAGPTGPFSELPPVRTRPPAQLSLLKASKEPKPAKTANRQKKPRSSPRRSTIVLSEGSLISSGELQRRAPCEMLLFKLMDYESVQLAQCAVLHGNWNTNATDVIHLGAAGGRHHCIHTLGLSRMGVELMRGMIPDGLVQRENFVAMRAGGSAQGALPDVPKLTRLPASIKTVWVRLPETTSRNKRQWSRDTVLKEAVSAALPRMTVLALQTDPSADLEKLNSRTFDLVRHALANTQTVQTLELFLPTTPTGANLTEWPFNRLTRTLQRRLTVDTTGVQWRSLTRLSFMHPEPAQLATPHLLDRKAVRHMLGGASPVRSLALFFNFSDMGDAVRAFLPLVSGYFYAALGRVSQLLVHTVTHLMFLTQAVEDKSSNELVDPTRFPSIRPFSVAVAQYLPALTGVAAAQRSAMLEHLAVVLPHVRAASLQLPRLLCEVAGQPDEKCHAIHGEAALQLQTALRASPTLVRLKLDPGRTRWLPEAPLCGHGDERDVPWYVQALADAGPMPELRVLSIRTHVTDAERGNHLVRILENNPHLHTLVLYLHDRVVFADGVSSPGAVGREIRESLFSHHWWYSSGSPEFASMLNVAAPSCVIPGMFKEPASSVLKTRLRARYEPLVRALRASSVERLVVRTHLTYHIDGEAIPKHVAESRKKEAAAIERELTAYLAESTHAEVAPNVGATGVFWHPRLSKEFATASNVDRRFPTLDVVGDDAGWLSCSKAGI